MTLFSLVRRSLLKNRFTSILRQIQQRRQNSIPLPLHGLHYTSHRTNMHVHGEPVVLKNPSKCMTEKQTAMIIRHFHLQPQFKYELEPLRGTYRGPVGHRIA